MSMEEVKKRFVDEIKLRAYDDKYVDKKSPVQNVRNPVTYFTSPLDAKGDPCQCGCGKLAPKGRSFLPGHDQTALHDRVKQIGTVADFINWFDIVRG